MTMGGLKYWLRGGVWLTAEDGKKIGPHPRWQQQPEEDLLPGGVQPWVPLPDVVQRVRPLQELPAFQHFLWTGEHKLLL
jgi:hypothetical protein